MKTSENRYVLTPVRAIVTAFSFFIVSLFAVSCNNEEFHVGGGIVNGEDMEMGETTFPVKAWTVPDPVADTLSGRVVKSFVYKPDDPSSKIYRYYFNMVGRYSVPDICDVDAGFAVRLQISANLPSFGDVVVDSVDMVVSYTPVENFSESYNYGYTGYDTNTNIYKGLFPSGYAFYATPVSHAMELEVYRLAEPIPDQYYYVPGTNVSKENYIPLTKKWATSDVILKESFLIDLDTVRSKVTIADTTVNYDDEGEVIDTTYRYADSLYPRMSFRLSKDYWQGVMDHFNGQIITQQSFQDYFNGLYFKAADNSQTPLMLLDMGQTTEDEQRGCYIKIFYHTAYSTGNTLTLSFIGETDEASIAANSVQTTLNPRIQAMIENPDTINGEKELYILPFGQTEVVVDLINEDVIRTIKDNGWTINDAYIEFTNKNYTDMVGNTPAAELWMYKYPYADQFIYWNSETGYPSREVDFYIPDQAAFEEIDGNWYFVNRSNYGLNGIINENASTDKFARPGKYKMRVTRTLIDAVYGDQKPVKVGLRLPFDVPQDAPNMSVLDGQNLRLVVKYTKKREE